MWLAVVADEELVGREPSLSLACDAEAERPKRARVEPLTGLDVSHAQANMVEEPSGMRLRHGYKYEPFLVWATRRSSRQHLLQNASKWRRAVSEIYETSRGSAE
jgi:hypothetical protein